MVEIMLPSRRAILFCCNDWDYFFLHRLPPVKAAMDDGWKATVCAGGAMPDQSRAPSMDMVQFDVERHRFAPVGDPVAIFRLVRLARLVNADVVHAITIKPVFFALVGFGLKRLFGGNRGMPRLVLTFPGLGRTFEDMRPLARLKRSIVVRAMRFFARRLDAHATFENEFDRNHLVDLGVFQREQTTVTFGAGINTSLFHPAATKRAGPLRFLFAARLIHAKGVEDFIEAARQRRRAGSKAEFIVAGLPDLSNPDALPAAKLEDAERAGTILLAGAVPGHAMPELLRSVDVVCLPTRLREGFPRVLIEAAASGAALLASRQPSVAQIIHEGVNGWMTEASSVDELAARMADMESNPEATRMMGEASMTLARSFPLSEDEVNAVFLQLYRS